MVKRFSFVKKRHGLSDDAFVAHWRDVHGELARDIGRLRRYVQNRRVPASGLGLPTAAYDGASEVWFDSLEAAEGLSEDPQYLSGCRIDEPNLLDLRRKAFAVTGERVLTPGPPIGAEPRGLKLLHLVRRPAGIAREDFASRWGSQLEAEAGTAIGATRHVINPSLPATFADATWAKTAADTSDPEAPLDGVRELWWPDLPSFRTARDGNNEAWEALVDERLIDVARSSALLVDEFCVIWP